jgi:hypothetical protein
MNTKVKPNSVATNRSRAPAADTRLRHNNAPEVRGDHSVRQDAERTNADVDTEELEQLLRDEFEQNSLPSPPPIPGFHLAWLNNAGSHDPLQRRMRLGYTLVRQSELPGFDPTPSASLSGNQREDGNILCNEMILCKLPESRYQAMMRQFHHKRPLEDEAGIVSRLSDGAGSTEDSAGRVLQAQEEGFLKLQERVRNSKTARAPEFA